jgi:multimeric flavodoxin WrbA
MQVAWENYSNRRKAPLTVKAGPEFTDPDYDLSQEWLALRNRLREAQNQHRVVPSRILVINASPRNEHTCPSEVSKSFRVAQHAIETLQNNGMQTDLLDLSEITAVYGKNIHPCKGCVSTAMPLCHWPCSCYPNHSLGQVQDVMGDIYEQWVKAHGVMIITPVHWYQVPSVLKLMMDRLVCADGGNPDPTSTHGKDADKAKKIELAGWDYPRPLKGRAFSVVVHGDLTGADTVRRNLTDWLTDMQLVPAGPRSTLSIMWVTTNPMPIVMKNLIRIRAFSKMSKTLRSCLQGRSSSFEQVNKHQSIKIYQKVVITN